LLVLSARIVSSISSGLFSTSSIFLSAVPSDVNPYPSFGFPSDIDGANSQSIDASAGKVFSPDEGMTDFRVNVI
jgi:hypothetical protein